MAFFRIRILIISAFLIFGKISSQDSLQTVIAQKGDGIYSMLRKQGIDPVKYYGDFVSLNQENLRDSVHLFEGRSYIIPAVIVDTSTVKKTIEKKEQIKEVVSKSVPYPIFGKKHAIVTAKSEKLKGTVYYLISGHGGPDPGAITTYKGTTIAEDEYAYDITLRLAKELIAHGALVYIIIRDSNDGIRDGRILEIDRDEVCYPEEIIPLGQSARLKQRVNVVNDLYLKHTGKYRRLIVTHIDSRSKGQNIDVFFYHHEKSKNGKRLAESIHKTFLKKYKKHQPNRKYEGTISNRQIYLVGNTLPAMTYIEIGNIRNKKDQKRILDPENRDALAKWISEGVLLDYEQEK